MITGQKRTIRKAQGYDLGFEYKGTEYWINTSKWNEEKEERFCKETGLKAFREESENKNLVFYDPEYFEVEYFFGVPYLQYKNTQQENIPQPINMSSGYCMFEGCKNLTSLDLSNWDVSKVEFMDYMFSCCEKLTSLNIDNWDVSKVKDMENMFSNCYNLTPLDLSNWDVSKVENMVSMFRNCRNLTSLDLSNWDASKVENMGFMFYYCENLTSLNLANWDVSKVKNMTSMFAECKNLTSLDLNNWDVLKVKYMGGMFSNCDSLYQKYNTKFDGELLQKIIEDSNKNNNLSTMNLF